MNPLGMALQATKEVTKWVLDGAHKAKDADERMAICNACEFLKGDRCDKCGCFMSIKTKMATAQCPIGKW